MRNTFLLMLSALVMAGLLILRARRHYPSDVLSAADYEARTARHDVEPNVDEADVQRGNDAHAPAFSAPSARPGLNLEGVDPWRPWCRPATRRTQGWRTRVRPGGARRR
jgi:hypothetical protein